MSESEWDIERQALDAAYVAAFGHLFQVLISGWTSSGSKSALERFEKGLEIQRDAYREVLQIISNADA